MMPTSLPWGRFGLAAFLGLALITSGCLSMDPDNPDRRSGPEGPCAHLYAPGEGAQILVHVIPRSDGGRDGIPSQFNLQSELPQKLREEFERMGMHVNPAYNTTDAQDCVRFLALVPGTYALRATGYASAPYYIDDAVHGNMTAFTDSDGNLLTYPVGMPVCCWCSWEGQADVKVTFERFIEVDVNVRKVCGA